MKITIKTERTLKKHGWREECPEEKYNTWTRNNKTGKKQVLTYYWDVRRFFCKTWK